MSSDPSNTPHQTHFSVPGLLALSPAIVFVLLYVVISLVAGDFYAMPITVALVAASVWGVALYRGRNLHDRIETFSRAAGNPGILYMVWIFILAGAFAALAAHIGAIDAAVRITLNIFPPSLILPGIFVAACFISVSIGTSVGTVVALTPLVAQLASVSGGNTGLYVATVLGGAFFGDNLSFISDTTIAATRTQGCSMADKFKANLSIVLPAAIVTLAIYAVISHNYAPGTLDYHGAQTPWWYVTPYLLVIVTAVIGINVTVVLLTGIVSALVIGVATGTTPLEACTAMGTGIDGVGQLVIITVLAAGMLGLVKAMGGINYLLRIMTAHISSRRGAQMCIGGVVSLVNLCTANNTVAIITVGSLSRDISKRYGISPRKTASVLDTCSCIVQCLIPYGAQTLMAAGLAGISPVEPWPYLYYPWVLCAVVLLSMLRTRH